MFFRVGILLRYFTRPSKQVGVVHSIWSSIRISVVRKSINHEHRNYCISGMSIKMAFDKVVTSVVWCVVTNVSEGLFADIFSVGNSILAMGVKVAPKRMHRYTNYSALPSLLFS